MGGDIMTDGLSEQAKIAEEEGAKIILKKMVYFIQVDWNFEKY